MGRKIVIVGAGAVGGYAGAHMVQAGEDVTFIDPWPEHVEHMRKHGLRVTHARDVAEFSVPVRALHVTDAQQLAKEAPVDIAFVCMKSYDTGLGHHADQAVSGAGRLCGVAAELHERGDDRRHRRLGQDAGLHRQQHHRQSAGARPHPSRRRQARRGAHRVSRRRSARPHHAAGGRSLPAGRLRRQRQGRPTICGASAGRSWSPTSWATGSPPAPACPAARCCRTSRSAASPPGSAAKRSASARRSAISWRRFCTCRRRPSRAPAKATRRRCAPATTSASRTASAPPPGSVPRWARTCRRAAAPRSNSSTVLWCARAKRSASPARANAVLTDIVKRVERGELTPDPRHITELRLN